MYKSDRDRQFKFSDFNQPMGLKMNPENRWVLKATAILWNEIEDRYAKLFPGKNGMPAKLDMSIYERGIVRLERLSFDSYNECDVLIGAIENYHRRTGRYPERVLVDQIYRTRKNRTYCKVHGIRMSGPLLGRPKAMTPEEKHQSYVDEVDRIEVERGFSLAKRSYGLGLLRTKLDMTTRSSIALSLLAMNLSRLAGSFLRHMTITIFSRWKWQNLLPKNAFGGYEIYLCIC